MGGEYSRDLLTIERGFQIVKKIQLPKEAPLLGSLVFAFDAEPWLFNSQEGSDPTGDFVWSNLFRYHEDKWQLVGTHKEPASHHGFDLILPLQNGRFFGVRRSRFARSGKMEAPFYELSLDEAGQFKVAGNLSGGIPPEWFNLPGITRYFQTVFFDDVFCLVDRHPGWIWVFSRQDGALKRVVRIYEELDEASLKKNNFTSVVLHSQPTDDGLLLISARSRNTAGTDDLIHRVNQATAGQPSVVSPPPEMGSSIRMLEPTKVADSDITTAFQMHSEIVWWTLDPLTGTLKAMVPPPEGAPQAINSMLDFMTFEWVPIWGGGVSFTTVNDLIQQADALAQAKALEKKREEAKDKAKIKSTPKEMTTSQVLPKP
jgi:hypothetical protein